MWRKNSYLYVVCGYNQSPDPLDGKDGIPGVELKDSRDAYKKWHCFTPLDI